MSRHRTGGRVARRKRGFIRRTGIVFPAAVLALVVVLAVTAAAYVMNPGPSAAGAAAAIRAIPGSHALTVLESERQELIAMTDATDTLTVVTKPQVVTPRQAASAGTGSSTTSGTVYVPAAPPNPGAAEQIARSLMPGFGFPVATYYNCLYDIWQKESGWSYDAENPSGAYGIPQSLPGSKMASAGADWRTDPATQIKWGLGYIKAVYGNPCAAWAFEESHNYY